MSHASDISQASAAAQAIDRVLQAEVAAQASLAQAGDLAHETLERAREDALTQVNRALARIAVWQQSHAVALAVDASPEAQACRDAYLALLGPLAQLGTCAGNLERLAAEYRSTERRAKALENVLLPEIEHVLSAIEERLEEGDQEEAVRVRLAGRRR